jgi:hypothetical protein
MNPIDEESPGAKDFDSENEYDIGCMSPNLVSMSTKIMEVNSLSYMCPELFEKVNSPKK